MKDIVEFQGAKPVYAVEDWSVRPRPIGTIIRPAPKGFYRSWGKRVLDILSSAVAILLLSPVLLIVWALVRMDGGPGLYSQPRVGMNGKTFRCWKLRTMVVDADAALARMCDADPVIAKEWHENQKLEHDPRITRIGRILRASSIDELPQLFNVLMGDMSIVGPRPFISNQAELYNEAGGRSYYTVRPGITGTWQVFGRSQTRFVDRVKFDTLYCRDISLWNDIYLIVMTVGVVLRRTGT